MIKIGFDDEPAVYDDELNDEQEERHGDRFNYEKRKSVYLSPARIEALKKDYDCVVVRDFGDEYHLSEEEREAKNKYYNTFKALRKAKKNYRKLDEFVKVTRDALKCLDEVANNNGMYSPEEFKELYFKGKIFINGLSFPKYKGKDRKDISWEYLTEFILSDEDAKEILPKKKSQEILTDDEILSEANRLFTKEEFDNIMKGPSEKEEAERLRYFDVDTDSQDGKNVVVYLDKEQSRKILKSQPELLYQIKEIKRDMKSADHLKSFAYDLTMDDIEKIESYDRKHNYVSSTDIPKFTGDITNSKQYHKYMRKLEDYEDNCIKENYNGRMKTQSEIREIELKGLLEENGWNIRAIYNNKEKEKKLKKALKQDKKRERQLKNQLIELQKRRQRRMGEDVDSSSKKSKKKKSKKKSKGYD